MKKVLQMSLFCCGLLFAVAGNSQNVYPKEKFPNTFSGSGSFTGDIGNWTAVLAGSNILAVDNTQSYSADNSLRMGITNNADGTHSSTVTSPVYDLLAISCDPSSRSVIVKYRLYFTSLVNSTDFSFAINVSSAAVPAWTNVFSQNATQLNVTYNSGTWYEMVLTLPSTYRTANFRLQFVTTKIGTSNDDNVLCIDDPVVLDPAIPDFSGTPTYTDVAPAGVSVNDVYTYASVATFPEPIYAEIKIEAIVNATLDNIDNNSPDAGVSQRFQPRIAPNPQNMNANQEGYFQFAITYRKVSDNNVVNFTGLRYRHFDIDGATGTGFTFRETGWITGHGAFLVNAPSDLADGGTVASGGYSWKKALGELSEHTSISLDPDVYYTAVYGAVSVIRFRLGYQFTSTGGNATYGAREYATEFGCFDITNNIPLPVKLLNFSGVYKNQVTLLNWETENQVNFDHFEIERSSNGTEFLNIASKPATGGTGKQAYQHGDNLSAVNGDVFYYRLKMVDVDGKHKYSNVIMIRKTNQHIDGLNLSPNPVRNGVATVRFTSASPGTAEFRVMDLSGKIVLRQTSKVFEGTNSISIDKLDRLQPGIYTIQMQDRNTVVAAKFTVVR